MTFVHGKNTVITVDANDLTAYVDSSELPRTRDTHDVTTYGNNSHRKRGGLKDGTFTMSGTYDNTDLTGPQAVLEPLLDVDDPVAIVWQPEGVGSGKAQSSFNAVLTKWTPTAPVADMVKWSAEFEIDGDVDTTPQT